MYLKASPHSTVCNKCKETLEAGMFYHQELKTSPGYHIFITGECCMTDEQLLAAGVSRARARESKQTKTKTVEVATDQLGFEGV